MVRSVGMVLQSVVLSVGMILQSVVPSVVMAPQPVVFSVGMVPQPVVLSVGKILHPVVLSLELLVCVVAVRICVRWDPADVYFARLLSAMFVRGFAMLEGISAVD